jgi:hypothetical protein
VSGDLDRRSFLKGTALAGLGAGLGLGAAPPGEAASVPREPVPTAYAAAGGFTAPALPQVRLGFVGVGLQGGGHVENFLKIDGVEIVALADIDAARAEEVASWVVAAGRKKPALYTRGEHDFLRLVERDDLDLVLTATPWEWHVPVCVAAMNAGKHAATEVPAAYTVDGCWELVETAERTLRHCVMLENCCYGRSEMMVLKMVRSGLLGELLHAEGAYIHDLRAIKLDTKNEGLWRWQHSLTRNGNLYPTHGLGPVAQCLDINRGDAFDYLVSMSSPVRGLGAWAREHLPDSDPRRRMDFVLGDMNSTLIKTQRGRTILVQHDTTTPRPYSRLNLVQGTRGTFSGYPDKIFVEGRTPTHAWESIESYRAEFDHPLWAANHAAAAGAGHGGMDFMEDFRLIAALRAGTPMDMDVYDAAAWSVICELSERSVAGRSQPQTVPDFTRGRWPLRTPLGIVS